MHSDQYYIEKTIELAKKGEGFVSPNPLVGAVLVKGKKIIATGYHARCGGPHAEIRALKKAKKTARGSTLYVNLEPCCHQGKTPPCLDEIIAHNVRKVVIATLDPNPLVKGKSVRALKRNGIAVVNGICGERARMLNEVFFKNMQAQLPFVAVKLAQSLDGKIALQGGHSKWITSGRSRTHARHLRDRYDAVCVGVETVIRDNPRLNGIKKKPFKVVLDPTLKIPFHSNLVRDAKRLLLIHSAQAKKEKIIRLKKRGISLVAVGMHQSVFNLKQLLAICYRRGIHSVFVEGGAHTIGTFFDAARVDKLYLFIAPKILGGAHSLSSIGARGIPSLTKAIRLRKVSLEWRGKDMCIVGYPVFAK